MFKYIIAFLLLTNIASAQWYRWEPIRNQKGQCKCLTDIMSHTNDVFGDSEGPETKAHESLHGCNNDLRNKWGSETYTGLYMLNNAAYRVKEPQFKLNDLARAIPQKYRKDIYDLYLIKQQQYFSNSPAYILDELTAYQVGAITGIQLNNIARAEESFGSAVELTCYAIFLKRISKQKDINEIVDFIVGRNKLIHERLPHKRPQAVNNYKDLMDLVGEKQ